MWRAFTYYSLCLRAFPCILFAKGYVPNMHDWMGAMDRIVTRADSVIIGEAMVRGLPIMLSAFSPGQEVTKGGVIAFLRPSLWSPCMCMES